MFSACFDCLTSICSVEELEKYGIQDVEDTAMNQNAPHNTPKNEMTEISRWKILTKNFQVSKQPKTLGWRIDIFIVLAIKS